MRIASGAECILMGILSVVAGVCTGIDPFGSFICSILAILIKDIILGNYKYEPEE